MLIGDQYFPQFVPITCFVQSINLKLLLLLSIRGQNVPATTRAGKTPAHPDLRNGVSGQYCRVDDIQSAALHEPQEFHHCVHKDVLDRIISGF